MERRVVIRIMFEKLDVEKLADLVQQLEAVADEFGKAEAEYSILPERPAG